MEQLMKKILLVSLLLFSMATAGNSFACVGRILVIGSLNNPNNTLLTQMMAVIVTERTGTTVEIKYFDTQDALYGAVKKKEVNVLVENTGRAMQLLGMEPTGKADENYATVKKAYRDRLDLVMLDPFGTVPGKDNGDTRFEDVPVVASGILSNFPVLPRVLNKLAGITRDRRYPKMLASVTSGSTASKVAKDFLKKKKFI